MSSIEKQLLINRGLKKLPYDMVDMIKSYCFETKKNAAIINNTKLNKAYLLCALKSMEFWRVHNYNDDHWMIGFNGTSYVSSYVSYNVYKMIEGINCIDCGEYLSVGTMRMLNAMPKSIFCKCPISIGDAEEDWDY